MRALLWYVLLVLIISSIAWGQVSTGAINGVVSDSSGAVVVGAKVVIRHEATGLQRETVTNGSGEFNVPYLPIGVHSITVTMNGFRAAVMSGIELQVDKTLNLPLVLQVGAMADSVQVTAVAPLVDSSTSSLGQVIDNRKIIDMPLNGRNAFSLGSLSGYAAPTAGLQGSSSNMTSSNNGSNLTFVAGGGRPQDNEVLLDGLDDNGRDPLGFAGVAYTPSVDAVAEFKVKTNNYSAEYGHSAGAIISATTKSGTNTVHGAAWDFLRNEKLDANNFISNAGGRPRQPFKQNQFGFTLGGPVYVPKLYNGHNKTFFFVDYEGLRRRTSAASSLIDTPPAAFRQGNFSSSGYTIYDPGGRHFNANGVVVSTPFPNNTIPTSLLNPASMALAGQFPQPNSGLPGAAASNYLFIAPQPFGTDQYDFRIDHQLSQNNNLFSRYSHSEASQISPGTMPGFVGWPSSSYFYATQAILSDTAILSPHVVNEARLGYVRESRGLTPTMAADSLAFAQKNNMAVFPTPVPQFANVAFSWSGQPFGTNEFTTLGTIQSLYRYVSNTYVGSENLSWNKGSHALKFGAEVRRYRQEALEGPVQETYGPTFSSSSDAPNSGLPFADFLMGFPTSYGGTPMMDYGRPQFIYAGGYAQDDWKVTTRLTLNLGLRYELYTQPVDARDLGGILDFTKGYFDTPGSDGLSRAMVKGHHKSWGPRLGYAYSASNRWTVRGGAGVFYIGREEDMQNFEFAENPPNIAGISSPLISASKTISPPLTISSPIVFVKSDPTLSAFTPQSPSGTVYRSPSIDNSGPAIIYQWNQSFQYQPAKDLVLEASYSALRGTHLVTRQNLNQLPWDKAMQGHTAQTDRMVPKINAAAFLVTSSGNSFYNGLNLRAEKRATNGLTFLANFTWSKNLQSNGTGGNVLYNQRGGTTAPLDSWNLRKDKTYAELDVPHVFVISAAYELPFGRGKQLVNQGGVPSFLLGGWQLGGILTLENGFPTDIRSGQVPSAGQLYATINVPDLVPGQSLYLPNRGPNGWFNPAAFAQPHSVLNANGVPITMFGNAARLVGRGPGLENLDFSILRNFRMREHFNLQFRTEAFNLTNTPAFYLPSASSAALTIGNAGFGKLTSSSATGRQAQFGLKLVF